MTKEQLAALALQAEADRDDAIQQAAASIISSTAIYLYGEKLPAEFRFSESGRSIYCTFRIGDRDHRVNVLGRDNPAIHVAIWNACKRGGLYEVDGEELTGVLSGSWEVAQRAQRVADPGKQARGPVPDKYFAGQVLKGKTYEIRFDASLEKTRIIFQREPEEPIKEIVKAAKFYYNRVTRSWNKGLTFKAFRAAEKLHAELIAAGA